jgi:hypothetical protein
LWPHVWSPAPSNGRANKLCNADVTYDKTPRGVIGDDGCAVQGANLILKGF